MTAFFLADLKMMVRNGQAMFWAMAFPLIFVVVFGLFDFSLPTFSSIAVVDESGSPASRQVIEQVSAIYLLEVEEEIPDERMARELIAQGDLDYLLVLPAGLGSPAGQSPDSRATLVAASANGGRNQLVEGSIRNILSGVSGGAPGAAASGAPAEGSATEASAMEGVLVSQEVAVTRIPYFEIVLLGLVGMGIMNNAIISIAVRISNYRNMSILKRLLVTPFPIWKYFVGEVGAHLVIAVVQAVIIIAVGVLVFGANIHGNPIDLFVIVVLGSLVFLNVGFIVSAYSRNPAAASGMGNAIGLPMMFFSGTFFPTATLPWVLPYVAEALPLTPMLEALRAVGNEGDPLWSVWPQLAVLAGWVLGTGVVATKVFKFE